jgi:predicted anti-sigma-YlaC factor YlaD
VIRALSDEDATLADVLILDHLPSCTGCRETLAIFQRIAADLALAAPAAAPPESLLLKLTRELGPDAERQER